MLRPALMTLGLLAVSGNALAQLTIATEPEAPKVEARVSIAGLYGDDSITTRHPSFTELRAQFDIDPSREQLKLSFHGDARYRQGWTDVTDNRLAVTRMYAQYQTERDDWFVAAGRLQSDVVSQAQIDGAQLAVRLAPGWHASVFGGIAPHPITQAVDPRFILFGGGYRARTPETNHAGGVGIRLYEGGLDRLFVSERFFFRPLEVINIFGTATIDFASQSGLFGDLSETPIEDQKGLDRLDPTFVNFNVRFRPARVFDVTFSGTHSHTLLPNKWWDDWVEQERARLGFSIDGPNPIGSRRSNARITSNLRLGAVTPYVMVRYDRRHDDAKSGYAAQLGVKLASFSIGYLDVSGTARRHFEAQQVIGRLQGGLDLVAGLSIDAGASAMRLKIIENEFRDVLYDLHVGVGLDLRTLSDQLDGLYLQALYQGFIDSEMTQHLGYARLGYRFRI